MYGVRQIGRYSITEVSGKLDISVYVPLLLGVFLAPCAVRPVYTNTLSKSPWLNKSSPSCRQQTELPIPNCSAGSSLGNESLLVASWTPSDSASKPASMDEAEAAQHLKFQNDNLAHKPHFVLCSHNLRE